MKKIIDVSEHNGTIDFEKVKKAGIEGVIIRIGWIGNKNNHTLDKKFKANYNKCVKAGLKIGFYVYSYCKSVNTILQGALWTYNQIKDLKFDLPVYLDLEDKTIGDLGKDELTSHVVNFCNYFLMTNIKSGVYASKDWFINKLDINYLTKYNIWLAEWRNSEKPSVKFKVDLWQYTSDGSVDGIKGRVDMNYLLTDFVENVDKIVDNVEKSQKEDFVEVKKYKNGSTPETVFADSNLSIKIGQLYRYAECECLGIQNNRYIVKYKVNNKNNYKIGFVKYSGGVK